MLLEVLAATLLSQHAIQYAHACSEFMSCSYMLWTSCVSDSKSSLRRAGTLHGPHGQAGCHQWGPDCMAARALKALLRGHASGGGSWESLLCICRSHGLPDPPGTHNQRHSCENRGAQPQPLPTYDERIYVGAAPSPAQEGCAFASRCWPKA